VVPVRGATTGSSCALAGRFEDRHALGPIPVRTTGTMPSLLIACSVRFARALGANDARPVRQAPRLSSRPGGGGRPHRHAADGDGDRHDDGDHCALGNRLSYRAARARKRIGAARLWRRGHQAPPPSSCSRGRGTYSACHRRPLIARACARARVLEQCLRRGAPARPRASVSFAGEGFRGGYPVMPATVTVTYFARARVRACASEAVRPLPSRRNRPLSRRFDAGGVSRTLTPPLGATDFKSPPAASARFALTENIVQCAVFCRALTALNFCPLRLFVWPRSGPTVRRATDTPASPGFERLIFRSRRMRRGSARRRGSELLRPSSRRRSG
jgi:hypothetical protein